MLETASYLIISLVLLAYTFTNFTVGHFYTNLTTFENQFLLVPRLVGDQFQKELTAKSVLVIDRQTKTVLWAKESGQRRSIASLTKLITALVFLETQPDWEQFIELTTSDFQAGDSRFLRKGEQFTVKDLFNIALISSDNVAVTTLVRSTNIPSAEFINQMNVKARILGMTNSEFIDPTGLSAKNQSTVTDLSKLANKAFADPLIQEALSLKKYSVQVKPKNTLRVIENTNKLLTGENTKFLYGKTGSTEEAGYCLISEYETKNSNQVIIILLGSENDELRFSETKALAEWVSNNFDF